MVVLFKPPFKITFVNVPSAFQLVYRNICIDYDCIEQDEYEQYFFQGIAFLAEHTNLMLTGARILLWEVIQCHKKDHFLKNGLLSKVIIVISDDHKRPVVWQYQVFSFAA